MLARWSDAGLSGTSDNGSHRLANRAAAIGRPVPQRVTTTDAALQVLANQAVSDRSSGDRIASFLSCRVALTPCARFRWLTPILPKVGGLSERDGQIISRWTDGEAVAAWTTRSTPRRRRSTPHGASCPTCRVCHCRRWERELQREFRCLIAGAATYRPAIEALAARLVKRRTLTSQARRAARLPLGRAQSRR